MGADRIIKLNRKITQAELQTILDKAEVSWRDLDVSIVPDGLHLHYAYWGISHAENAHRKTSKIIRELRKINIIKNLGKWGY